MAKFDIEIGSSGNGATDVAKSIDAIINKLANAEKYSETFNNSIKGQQSVLRAYEGALKSLISQGFNTLDPSVKAVKSEIDRLTASLNAQKTALADQKAIDNLNVKLEQIASSEALMSNETARVTAQTRAFQGAINSLIRQGVNPADERIKQLKSTIAQLGSTQSKGGGGFLSGLASQAIGAVTAMASVYTAINAIKGIATSNIGISDQLSDVRRTAELTRKEVEGFVDELKNIPTRTGLSELLDIAVIAGQLGIAKDELAGFVQALDFLGVALATEIPGGAEAVAESLGKINGVFKVTQREGISSGEAMQKTGSAILALGQAGLATGEFITNFANRVGGAASVVDIALPTMLAYGAVLEESGVTAEVAGTAVSKLLGQLAVKRADFAAIAQLADASLTLEEFTSLINTDADAALQKFFQGLDAGGTSTTAFYDILSQAGINTERYRNAVLLLSQNQGRLAELTALSTKEFESGSNAAEQFALRNMNLAGVLGQVGRMIKEAFISPESQNGLALLIAQAAGLASKSDILRIRLKELSDESSNLDRQLRPLMDRYDDLNGLTNRSAEENEELRKVVNQIAGVLPEAVTKWDEYGNAIEISTGKVIALTEAQKGLIRDTNISYGKQLNKEYDEAIKRIEEISDLQKKLSLSGLPRMATRFSEVSGMGRGFVDAGDLAEKMAKEQQKSLDIINNLLDSEQSLTSEQQKRLDFYTKETDLKKGSLDISEGQNGAAEKQIGIIKRLEDELKSLKDARPDITVLSDLNENKRLIDEVQAELDKLNGKGASRRVISDLDKIKKFIEDSDFSVSLLSMDDRGRAEAQIRKRYESMLSSVKSGSDEYVRLNENMNIEIQVSNQKFADADAKLISDMVKKRAAAIQQNAQKIISEQESQYQDLLKAHRSYLQKAQAAEEKYQEAIQRARKEGKNEEADSMERAMAKEISDIYKQEIEDSDPFKALDESLKSAGTRVARQAVKDADAFIKSFIKGIKDPNKAKEINEWWEGLSAGMINALDSEDWEVVSSLADGFANMAQSAMSFDGSMRSALKAAGAMVKESAALAKNLGSSFNDSGLTKAGGILGIVGAFVGAFGSIGDAIDSSYSRARAADEQYKKKQIESIDASTRALEIQIGIIEHLFGTERIEKWKEAQLSAINEVDSTLGRLNDRGVFSVDPLNEDDTRAIRTLEQYDYDTAKMEKDLADLKKKQKAWWNPFRGDYSPAIEDLERALTFSSTATYALGWNTINDITREGAAKVRAEIAAGHFDEVTAAELTKVLDQYDIYIDAMRAKAEELTGISISGLISDATSLFFDSGEDSADAWGKGFEKVMKQYAKKRFQTMFLEVAMKGWYDKMAKMAEDGIDAEESEILRQDWQDIYAGGEKERENLKNALGFDPFENESDSASGKAGLRGAIERMSEQTGSELTGIYRASYEIDKESLGKLHFIDINMNALVGINGQQLEVLEGIKEDTGSIAEHTSHLEEMSSALIEIAVNTRLGKGKSERDNGVM